jgi:Peptidoglycan-binding protein, CsiV
MPRYLKALLIASLAWTAPASAQDGGADEPRRLYRIEVIVFAHNDGNPTEELFAHEQGDADLSAGNAPAPLPPPTVPAQMQMPPVIRSFGLPPEGQPGWLDRGPLPVPALAPIILGNPVDPYPVDALPAGGGEPTRTPVSPPAAAGSRKPGIDDPLTDVTPGGLRFRPLKPDELKLNDSERRLRNLSAYDVLAHGGWVQEALPENAAVPFDVGYLGTVNPSGTIRLHVTRFLHLSFDLRYRLPYTAVADNPLELAEIELGPTYRLVEQRRARSNELHYIDHPLFGVLVLVTPEERSATDAEPAA